MSIDATATTRTRHPRSPQRPSVRFQGYRIDAPGFDADALDRAIHRALREGVLLAPARRPGTFRASRPGSPATYLTSRSTCSCRAGQRGTACKHRALVCLAVNLFDMPADDPSDPELIDGHSPAFWERIGDWGRPGAVIIEHPPDNPPAGDRDRADPQHDDTDERLGADRRRHTERPNHDHARRD